MKKVNWLINRVKEDYQNREKRKKKIEEENITKEEEKNRQIRIFKKRAEELKYSLDKTEKGDVFTAKWRGRTIGVYAGKGLPTPTLEKLKAKTNFSEIVRYDSIEEFAMELDKQFNECALWTIN